MPHASGGGSSGGGSSGFRGAYYGGIGRGRYYAGSRIRLNDPNDGTDRYLGKASLAKTKKDFARSMTITTILTVILSVVLSLGVPLNAEKVAASENFQPAIYDNAGVIADEEKLMGTLNEYRELTGITPVIYTVYEEDWKTEKSSNLTNYAMEQYLRTATDETHFVIVYSVPKAEASSAANGGVKNVTNRIGSVQGNLTDPILRDATYWKFVGAVKFNSLTGSAPGDAFEKAFQFAISDAKIKLDPSIGCRILTLFDNIPLVFVWLICLVIFIVIISRFVKERKAGYEQLQSDSRLE